MKTWKVYLLAIGLVVSLTSCAPVERGSMSGSWELTYDWDCTGSHDIGTALCTFFDAGDFVCGDLHRTGQWSMDGDTLTMDFDLFGSAYQGSRQGENYSGVMQKPSGESGCWSMTPQ